MEDFLSSMGCQCYTSPAELGFGGSIKASAEDFCVTEVDTTGCLVTIGSDVIPPLPVTDGSSATTPVAHTRQCTTDVPPLCNLIGHDCCAAVNALAESYRRTLTSEGRGSAEVAVEGDKQRRAWLHVAVRLAQPVLRTCSTRNQAGDMVVTAMPDPAYTRLRELLPSEESERLLVFVNTVDRSQKFRLQPDGCKDHRKQVHLLLRELYGGLLESKTFTAGGHTPCRKKPRLLDEAPQEACIELRFRSKPEKSSAEEGSFVKFTLRRTNIELLDAIQRLSEALHCQPSQFAFAGIKDKKAITLQQLTVKGVSPERLQAVCGHPRLSSLATGSYQCVDRHISLGQLGGNAFSVVVRGTSATTEAVVARAVEAVKEKGFVNYFGPQRFGCASTAERPGVAVRIGLAMLLGDHKRAVEVLLEPQENNHSATNTAKQYFVSSGADVSGALKRMPTHKTREVLVLKALRRYGYTQEGCRSALMGLPYSARKLYVHSVCSLLWNHLVSFRLQSLGLRPMEGDLVVSPGGVAGTKSTSVHIVTAEDIRSGCYGIGDVVLPVIGRGSVFPHNHIADRFHSLLALLHLSLESFRLAALSMNFPGAYRKLLATPSHMTYHMTPTHLTLDFRLEPSCYATILLRELMKKDL